MIKCRTCLEPAEEYTSTNITKEYMLRKSIKDILLLFIPEMVTSPQVGDLICCKCMRRVRNFTNFIEKCLTVEKFLTEENLKTQWEVESDSTPPSDDNVASGLSVNGNSIQNGVEYIKIQLIPINHLLASSQDTSIDKGGSTSPTNQNTNALPQVKDLVANGKPSTESDGISNNLTRNKADSKSKSEESRICYTCGDVFTCKEWMMIECTKCASNDKEIELDSDGISNDIDNNDGNEMEIEKQVIDLGKDFGKTRDIFKSLRGEFRDTIVSINRAPNQMNEFLVEISRNGLNIIDYRPRNATENKRIMLLGSTTSQCSECKALMKNPRALKVHFQKDHTIQELLSEEEDDSECGKIFECPFCDTNTTAALSLVKHLREMHSVENPFKCEKCGKVFKKRDVYLDHVKKFGNNSNCFLKKCRYCVDRVPISDYEEHVTGHRWIVCDRCGLRFHSDNSFREHYAAHTADDRERTEMHKPESFLCPVCGRFLCNQQSWKYHVETHGHRDRNYFCHVCPKRFLTAYYLNTHIANAHGEKKIACPICGIKVKTTSSLASHHKLKHSDEFAYKCKICNQGFTRTDYYKRHLVTHVTSVQGRKKKYNYSVKLESKPVKCKYCLKVFKNVYLLRTHLLSHVKTLRYKCKFCDMTFANTGTRFRHQKRHADPNFELSCTVCWKRMDSKEKLEAHLANHDVYKKYECAVCAELFCSKYLLRHHVTEKHIGKEDVEREKETVLADALEEFLL